MNAVETLSMWTEANIGKRSQETILWNFNHHFGFRFTVPKSKLIPLGKDHIEPTSESVEVNGTNVPFWHKSIGKVAEHSIDSHLSNLWSRIDSADVLVGADHGQGKSRAGGRSLLWSGHECLIDEV